MGYDFKVLTFYTSEEGEYGDYSKMKLLDYNDELVMELHDYYHDKSNIVIDAFLEGVAYGRGYELVVLRENVIEEN